MKKWIIIPLKNVNNKDSKINKVTEKNIEKKDKLKVSMKTFTSLCLCLLFAFVCLAFSFPLSIKDSQIINKTETEQTTVNNMVTYAVASEDTGASTAPSSEKGGCHYLGTGTKMTMSEGTITGTSKKYGGAVYISSGATFTMSGGTISGCTARYGGAIYVASGGTFNMTGGIIECNSATVASAIYVEDGANVTINGIIQNNTYGLYYISPSELVSEDTIMVGHLTNGIRMHYLDYGYYPQTYVGNSMNTTLENWYSATSPSEQITYEINTRTWTSYLYTDGNYYVRGSSYPYSSSYTYVDGTTVKSSGTITWFKVEPIRWIVLNYDEVQAGTATTIDCLSELGLTADIRFYPNTSDAGCNEWVNSDLRKWLNSNFINQAFTSDQQEKIATTTVLNNVTGDYSASTSDGKGITTEDKIYCLSYYEANTTYFSSSAQRLCSPTDFALNNFAYKYTATGYPTMLYPSGGTTFWRVRSSGSSASYVCCVDYGGNIGDNYDVSRSTRAVRPAISFSI